MIVRLGGVGGAGEQMTVLQGCEVTGSHRGGRGSSAGLQEALVELEESMASPTRAVKKRVCFNLANALYKMLYRCSLFTGKIVKKN